MNWSNGTKRSYVFNHDELVPILREDFNGEIWGGDQHYLARNLSRLIYTLIACDVQIQT